MKVLEPKESGLRKAKFCSLFGTSLSLEDFSASLRATLLANKQINSVHPKQSFFHG